MTTYYPVKQLVNTDTITKVVDDTCHVFIQFHLLERKPCLLDRKNMLTGIHLFNK